MSYQRRLLILVIKYACDSHPEHLKVAEYVASVVDKRSSVDYEVLSL